MDKPFTVSSVMWVKLPSPAAIRMLPCGRGFINSVNRSVSVYQGCNEWESDMGSIKLVNDRGPWDGQTRFT